MSDPFAGLNPEHDDDDPFEGLNAETDEDRQASPPDAWDRYSTAPIEKLPEIESPEHTDGIPWHDAMLRLVDPQHNALFQKPETLVRRAFGPAPQTSEVVHEHGYTPMPNTPDETALRSFGQMATFGIGDELAAANEAYGNKVRAAVDPMGEHTGRPAETAGRGIDAPLKGYDDYEADQTHLQEQGREDFPAEDMWGTLIGLPTVASVAPQFEAAEGAGLLARAGTGALNVGADTALSTGQAAASANPGSRLAAAEEAAKLAAPISAGLRVPGAVPGLLTGGRDFLAAQLPEETARSARALTDLTPAGRQTRAAAVAGQRGLDPTVRHITQLGNEVERTRDEALNWALSGGRKKQAMLDAVRGEMSAIPDKALPVKSPRVDYDYTYQFPGENTPTIPPPGRIPGPAPTPGGTTYQTGTADDLDFEHIIPETVKRPGAPEFGPDEIGSDTPTIPPAKEKSSIGLMKAQDFASQHGRQLEELAADPDLPSMSKQGIKRLIQLHKTTEAKIAAAFNEEDPAVALRDADHALDIYKQNLGRVTNQLGKSPENKFIYEHLNGMYHELRDHLEDETVWGTALSGKQTRVNAAHTNDFTQRQRFKNTLLTGDSALRSADPFKMRPEVDPAKVSGLLENAGRASNDIKERSMLEGFQSSSNLSDVLTDEYGANDKLRNKVSAQKKAVDDLLSSFADTRKNMTAAREMREVSKESPWLGRGANAMATVEDTIAKNPVLGKLASGAGATAQFASRAAPKYATMGAAEFEARKKNRERGHEIETAVDTALNTNPESLGPFLQRLQEAKQNDKLGTELFKLDADPQWRKLRSQF